MAAGGGSGRGSGPAAGSTGKLFDFGDGVILNIVQDADKSFVFLLQ